MSTFVKFFYTFFLFSSKKFLQMIEYIANKQ